MDCVEICNFCIRKVIIKAAKRIFNSDNICCSYCDFYFGVTFFWNTLYMTRPLMTVECAVVASVICLCKSVCTA